MPIEHIYRRFKSWVLKWITSGRVDMFLPPYVC